MHNILEAGLTGVIIVVGFVVGLTLLLKGRLTSIVPWALGLLAVGQIGQSVAQRAVAEAVTAVPHLKAIEMLALGCAEASANLLLAGACALSLLVVGQVKNFRHAGL
jgi:hypothetical protein